MGMGGELGQVRQAFLAQSAAGRHLEKGRPYPRGREGDRGCHDLRGARCRTSSEPASIAIRAGGQRLQTADVDISCDIDPALPALRPDLTGGVRDQYERLLGRSTDVIDANEEMWEFFARFTLP
jgi:hypothetical protein